MFGDINILFGKVVNVTDEQKIWRCQVSIDGSTDLLPVEDLPWYFPWYGINYLPVVNDVVPVIVFDGDFATCFYGRKVDHTTSDIEEGDYENYLEIFKRTVGDNDVQLTYKVSTGIEFINGTGKVQLEIDKVSLFVDSNSIVMTADRIDIGNASQEATILGDKGVKQLHDMIKHQANTIAEMLKMFNGVMSAAMGSPFTMPIGSALAPLVPAATTKLNTENAQVDAKADTIQSKKVFIE